MELNADFDKRVLIHSENLEWVNSPMPGVSRRMLDRVGDEVARATSIVRYAPNSHFSPHIHGGGEEFIVLDGVFQDEHGDFPIGSYIRNPPTSSHTPGSAPGCIIFVKLHQFDPTDRTHVRLRLDEVSLLADKKRDGVSTALLHQDDREQVLIENWTAGTLANLDTTGGAELLVLEGELKIDELTMRKHSWLRLPENLNTGSSATAGDNGARIWLKRGHLRFVNDDLAGLG